MIYIDHIFFQRLKDIREDLDLTQQEMASLLHVSQTSYSRWERKQELIPLRKLNQFCNITGHSMDYVIGKKTYEHQTFKQNCDLDPKQIGTNLKNIRIQNELSQLQLARLLNTTQSTISAYEHGETLILTAFAYQIVKLFNLSLDSFCNRKFPD